MAFWSLLEPGDQRRTWTPSEKEVYAIVMAPRKWAGYIALHPGTVCKGPRSLQLWHKEQVETPSAPASRRARWHKTMATFNLTVVCVPEEENNVADCLSRCAYPASRGITPVSADSDQAETSEANKMIHMEHPTCARATAGAKPRKQDEVVIDRTFFSLSITSPVIFDVFTFVYIV